jgi:hypothetical protein
MARAPGVAAIAKVRFYCREPYSGAARLVRMQNNAHEITSAFIASRCNLCDGSVFPTQRAQEFPAMVDMREHRVVVTRCTSQIG